LIIHQCRPYKAARPLCLSPYYPLRIVPQGCRNRSPDSAAPADIRGEIRQRRWPPYSLTPSNLPPPSRRTSLTPLRALFCSRTSSRWSSEAPASPAAAHLHVWKQSRFSITHSSSPWSPVPRPSIAVEQRSPEPRRPSSPVHPRRKVRRKPS
jgi:hypothetical protein